MCLQAESSPVSSTGSGSSFDQLEGKPPVSTNVVTSPLDNVTESSSSFRSPLLQQMMGTRAKCRSPGEMGKDSSIAHDIHKQEITPESEFVKHTSHVEELVSTERSTPCSASVIQADVLCTTDSVGVNADDESHSYAGQSETQQDLSGIGESKFLECESARSTVDSSVSVSSPLVNLGQKTSYSHLSSMAAENDNDTSQSVDVVADYVGMHDVNDILSVDTSAVVPGRDGQGVVVDKHGKHDVFLDDKSVYDHSDEPARQEKKSTDEHFTEPFVVASDCTDVFGLPDSQPLDNSVTYPEVLEAVTSGISPQPPFGGKEQTEYQTPLPNVSGLHSSEQLSFSTSEKAAGIQHGWMANVMPVSEVTEFSAGCEIPASGLYRDSAAADTENKACKLPDRSAESQLHEAVTETHSSILKETVSNCQSPDNIKTVEMKVQTLNDIASNVHSSEAAEALTVSQPHEILDLPCENPPADWSAQGPDSSFHVGSKSDEWQSFTAGSSLKMSDAAHADEIEEVCVGVSGHGFDMLSSFNTSIVSGSPELTNTTDPMQTSISASLPSEQMINLAQMPLVLPLSEGDRLVNPVSTEAATFDVVSHNDSDVGNRNLLDWSTSVLESNASGHSPATIIDLDRDVLCNSPPSIVGCADFVDWSANLKNGTGQCSGELVHLGSPAGGIKDFTALSAGDDLSSSFRVQHSVSDTNSNQANRGTEECTSSGSDAVIGFACRWPDAVQHEETVEKLPFSTRTAEAHKVNIADEPTVPQNDCLLICDLNTSSTRQWADTYNSQDDDENSGNAFALRPSTAVCLESTETEVPDVEQHLVADADKPVDACSGFHPSDVALVPESESRRHGDYQEDEDVDKADLPDGVFGYVSIGL